LSAISHTVSYHRIASLKTAEAFLQYLETLGITLPFDRALERGDTAPLARRFELNGTAVGNRFCILPMEGWDGTHDGRPSDLTRRRWQHFGRSGAKLIWGGEAFAVRHDGRANPNQLAMNEHAEEDLASLRKTLVDAHAAQHGSTDDLFIGLQLTHSGRYARPNPGGRWEPRTAYVHPVLERRFPTGTRIHKFSDGELDRLIEDFVRAAAMAACAGFAFVDIKHCHGYLGHELLTAVDREGTFGGPFEHRTSFLRRVVEGIRRDAPGMKVGVRLSAFDAVPYRKHGDDAGTPEIESAGYRHAFGLLPNGAFLPSLDEARAFLRAATSLGIDWICLTAGSPYYNPHIQRPALFPPSDGYLPPEDPLVGVARQIAVVSRLKHEFPQLAIVGSGYSYLQEWLPNVAQAAVRDGGVDFVGLGRMVLSYPEFASDVLAGKTLRRQFICRTFSDCTSGPRNGLVSGCFPLDPFYKAHPDAATLKATKEPVRHAEP
jgi:NADPH2 dehydrogenase